MNVISLFPDVQNGKTVQFQNMKLEMDRIDDGYLGLLEINSNKFYVKFDVEDSDTIGAFEIFSAKGYFELNLKIIKMIRTIVQNMYAIH